VAGFPDLHTVSVSRTARVATLGTPQKAPVWWVGLHGYGQLATEFVTHLDPLNAADHCVVAPEGLSRFYVDELDEHKQVGASWMTRVARTDDIRDCLHYLDTVVHRLSPDGSPPTVRVLGFSQGTATASRWAVRGDAPIDRLVLWGAPPAHDLDLAAHADALRAMDLTIVAGTNDPHLTDARRDAVRNRMAQHDIPVTVHTFDGGHRLDADLLHTLGPSSD